MVFYEWVVRNLQEPYHIFPCFSRISIKFSNNARVHTRCDLRSSGRPQGSRASDFRPLNRKQGRLAGDCPCPGRPPGDRICDLHSLNQSQGFRASNVSFIGRSPGDRICDLHSLNQSQGFRENDNEPRERQHAYLKPDLPNRCRFHCQLVTNRCP